MDEVNFPNTNKRLFFSFVTGSVINDKWMFEFKNLISLRLEGDGQFKNK